MQNNTAMLIFITKYKKGIRVQPELLSKTGFICEEISSDS